MLLVISALKSMTAEEVFSRFYDDLVCYYGCPAVVKSDQGTQLTGETSKAFFEMLASIRITTTPYSPWSNGAAEVNVRRTKQMVSKLLGESEQTQADGENIEWDQVIKKAQFALNSMPSTTRQFSPLYIYSGKEANISANLTYPVENERKNVPQVVRSLRQRQQLMFKTVSETLGVSRGRAKRHYDLRVKGEKLEIGEKVFLRKHTLMPHETRTFAPKYEADTYEVTKVLSDATVQIKNETNGQTKIVHFNNVKKVYKQEQNRQSDRDKKGTAEAEVDRDDGHKHVK